MIITKNNKKLDNIKSSKKELVCFNQSTITNNNDKNDKNKNLKVKSFNKKCNIGNSFKKKSLLKINKNNNLKKVLFNSENNNLKLDNIISNDNKKKSNENLKENIEFKEKEIQLSNIINTSDKKENKNKKLNKTYSESDLGEVGEIIEEENENELSELGENHFINNPKSIKPFSSIDFENKKFNKQQPLSLSKKKNLSILGGNHLIHLKENNFDMEDEKYYEEKYKNNQEIFEVINKIKSKNKDIEKFQKIIEKIKQRMKKYDNEIKTVNNWIYIEENKKENFQQMINFIINK